MITNTILYSKQVKFDIIADNVAGYTLDGIITSQTVGEAITSDDICYYANDGKMYKTHAIMFDKFPMMALQTVDINQPCLFFVRGYIKKVGWAWNVNSFSGNIFVDEFINRGKLTQKFDKYEQTEHYVFNTLGKILSPTELFYDPDIYLESTFEQHLSINIDPPVLNDPGLLCPFNFHLTASDAVIYNNSLDNNAIFINEAVWQIAEEPTFNKTLPGFIERVVSTSDIEFDFTEVIIDSGLIKQGTTYYCRLKYTYQIQ